VNTTPIVQCRLIAANGTRVYFACPHCKDKRGKPILHFHGIGAGLGHRVAHCYKSSGSPFLKVGYVLEPLPEEPSPC
jgi:hypothetical protein